MQYCEDSPVKKKKRKKVKQIIEFVSYTTKMPLNRKYQSSQKRLGRYGITFNKSILIPTSCVF